MRRGLRDPPSADALFVHLREDHFDVEPLHPDSRLTPHSVAAHTLYENANPYLIAEPSGTLDQRRVRVTGAAYLPSGTYSNKLEGSRLVGYQTIAIGGIRDRVIIEQLPKAQEYFRAKIKDVFAGRVDPDVVIDYHLYGRDAVLGPRDPARDEPAHELGVLITVTAPTQQIAHAVATFVAHASSHLPIPEYGGLASTIAYPSAPPETDRGPVFRFTLHHVACPRPRTSCFVPSTKR